MRQRTRSVIVAAYLLLCLLLGGSGQGIWRNLALQLGAVLLIAIAASAPEPAQTSEDRPRLLYVLLFAGFLLVFLQLLPLPPDVWAGLPGRSTIAAAHAALGQMPALPLSVAPYDTVAAVLALLPALALFIAVKLLRPSPRLLALTIAAGAAASIALGAVQLATGPRSYAYLYDITNIGAVGLFANRNHMGTLLLVSIPFATALLVSSGVDRQGSKQGRVAIAAAALLLAVVGIAMNGSMAAFAIAVPIFIASAALLPAAARWRRLALPLAGLAMLGAVAVLATTPLAPPAEEQASRIPSPTRPDIWAATAAAIGDSFPVGTGLGTFEEVFRQHENPATVTPRYVNHAHNDYLELALELGLPGMILMALFLGWWTWTALRIWKSPLSTPFGRAATIASGAILAHSVVDYPLRTAAISAIFAVALALMAQRLATEPPAHRQERRTRHVALG